MYKISDEAINIIEKTITLRVELTAGGRSLAETKIQKKVYFKEMHYHCKYF